jgi:hypothetical protein
MKADGTTLAAIDRAFRDVARPALFTVADDDPETMDHEALLSSKDHDSLTLEDVNNPGYHPMTECLPPGFAYYFPALARFALVHPTDPWNWYASLLLDKLRFREDGNEFYSYCNADQWSAVAGLLRHILSTRPTVVSESLDPEDFVHCLKAWEAGKLVL